MDNLKINITPEWVEKEDEGGVTLELQNILNFKVKGIKNKDDWENVKIKIDRLVSALNVSAKSEREQAELFKESIQKAIKTCKNTLYDSIRMKGALDVIREKLGTNLYKQIELLLKLADNTELTKCQIKSLFDMCFPINNLLAEKDSREPIPIDCFNCTVKGLKEAVIYFAEQNS